MTFKNKIIVLTGVLVVALATVFIANTYVTKTLNTPLNLADEEILEVSQGQYAHFVINRLYERNIISEPVIIKIALKLNPEIARIRVGTYELKPGMSALDLFELISSGREKQFSISLVEGLTWKNWKHQLNNHDKLEPGPENDQEWMAVMKDTPAGHAIEGWLLPETYYFTSRTSATEIFSRAHKDMQAYLTDAWENRALDLPYSNPYEALIMASIIEKETGLASERPRISGVFINRLRQNMRLQTDPTVIYGMGESFDGDIRRKDLRTATPYNTYVIKGLPPTPIAMPSKLAIDAALNPLDTDELYFVARGDGSHKFSKTLAEHNQAVRKYQLKK